MNTEKKRSFIINTIYVAIIVALIYLFMKYVFSIFLPFFIGFVVAFLLQGPISFINKKTKIPKKIISPILVTLCLVVVLVLLFLLLSVVVDQITGLANFLASQTGSLNEIMGIIEQELTRVASSLPEILREPVLDLISDAFSQDLTIDLTKFDVTWLSLPLQGILGAVTQIPSLFLSVIMAIISSYFMTSDYRMIVNFVLKQFPKKQSHLLSNAKSTFSNNIGKMLRAYILILFITFCELFVGFLIIGIDYAFVLAIIISILDILPILGTGTVLIPWTLYHFLFGNKTVALGLLLLYIVITVIRQILEPKIIGHQVGLHPIVTLLSMFAGLYFFGFIGLVIFPITIAVLNMMQENGQIKLWKSAGDKEEPNTAKTKTSTEN